MYYILDSGIEVESMTMCLGALYENGKGCVLQSDQMITIAYPLAIEYELSDPPKINEITKEFYVLIAGHVLFANKIIDLVKSKISSQPDASRFDMIEEFRAAYRNVRHTVITQNVVEPRGLTFDQYLANQTRLDQKIVAMIDQEYKMYNLGVEMILVNSDKEGKWHISSLINPAFIVSYDSIGFAAIGSGAIHANYSLIDDKYTKLCTKDKVISMCSKAKTRAEVAPGVGHNTSSIVLPLEESHG